MTSISGRSTRPVEAETEPGGICFPRGYLASSACTSVLPLQPGRAARCLSRPRISPSLPDLAPGQEPRLQSAPHRDSTAMLPAGVDGEQWRELQDWSLAPSRRKYPADVEPAFECSCSLTTSIEPLVTMGEAILTLSRENFSTASWLCCPADPKPSSVKSKRKIG
jgi:hypothetical protein